MQNRFVRLQNCFVRLQNCFVRPHNHKKPKSRENFWANELVRVILSCVAVKSKMVCVVKMV